MNHAAAGNHATVALNLAPDFVLCIGADKCDESMYEFISGLTFPQLNNDDVIKHVCSVSLRPSGAASSLHVRLFSFFFFSFSFTKPNTMFSRRMRFFFYLRLSPSLKRHDRLKLPLHKLYFFSPVLFKTN